MTNGISFVSYLSNIDRQLSETWDKFLLCSWPSNSLLFSSASWYQTLGQDEPPSASRAVAATLESGYVMKTHSSSWNGTWKDRLPRSLANVVFGVSGKERMQIPFCPLPSPIPVVSSSASPIEHCYQRISGNGKIKTFKSFAVSATNFKTTLFAIHSTPHTLKP